MPKSKLRKRAGALVPDEIIENKILSIRNQKVMLDKDLAELYGVETRALNQAVRRNIDRFPEDFMFQLNDKEFDILRSQIVTSKRGGQRYNPNVFTEQGVAMLSSVLNSVRAVEVNIAIMRTFVKIRKLAYSYRSLADKMEEIDSRHTSKHKKHDRKIKEIIGLLNFLIKGEEDKKKNKREIGFKG